MNHPGYDVSVSDDRLHYEFISTGLKGDIHKVIEYTYLPQLDMWNLGFGDFDTTTGQVSDSVVSNNGDGRKVISTVVGTLFSFFGVHVDATIIFTGSDERRTLLYRRIILQHYADFSDHLVIKGLNAAGIEMLIETNADYIAFVVRRK